jgi:hypothetical protein
MRKSWRSRMRFIRWSSSTYSAPVLSHVIEEVPAVAIRFDMMVQFSKFTGLGFVNNFSIYYRIVIYRSVQRATFTHPEKTSKSI